MIFFSLSLLPNTHNSSHHNSIIVEQSYFFSFSDHHKQNDPVYRNLLWWRGWVEQHHCNSTQPTYVFKKLWCRSVFSNNRGLQGKVWLLIMSGHYRHSYINLMTFERRIILMTVIRSQHFSKKCQHLYLFVDVFRHFSLIFIIKKDLFKGIIGSIK